MLTLTNLSTRIDDLQHQIFECRILGDYDQIESIEAELSQQNSAYAELIKKAPDYDQVPF